MQRATLSADFIAPGPPSGADVGPANGRTGPFPGQVIPGFSGMVDNGDGSFWALPDNGFGSKSNSTDFFLRLYDITPDWETAIGGTGDIAVGDFISMRDPDGLIPFPIVDEDTDERLLTGGDFDVESVVRLDDGTFWIGEEFGPFLFHIDAAGKLLSAPVEFPDGNSPANPFLGTDEVPRVRGSRGFEAMARSADGSKLYPIVEGSFADDDQPLRRFVYEFDTATETYTGNTWQYEAEADANVIGDAAMTGDGEMIVIERDDGEGPAAVYKQVYRITLGEPNVDEYVAKELVLNMLDIANPDGIGATTSPGAFGVGDPFSFPLQSVEVLVQLADGRILIANDNNYPSSNGRIAGTPDNTEMIVVDVAVTPDPEIPEAPVVVLLTLSGVALSGGVLYLDRRRNGVIALA